MALLTDALLGKWRQYYKEEVAEVAEAEHPRFVSFMDVDLVRQWVRLAGQAPYRLEN